VYATFSYTSVLGQEPGTARRIRTRQTARHSCTHPLEQLYDQGVVDREEAAASCLAGLAELYAHTGRPSWHQAMQEIQDNLAAWEVRPTRIGEVMSRAATGFVDSDAWRAEVALQLLVDAGAEVGRARVLRAQVPPRRVVGLTPGVTEPAGSAHAA
jgi:hypothetical protein